MGRLIIVFATSMASLLAQPTIARAQTASTPTPAVRETVEHIGFGVLTGIGTPGALGAFRVSVPATSKTAFDLDLGRVRGDGGSYGIQLRQLFRKRTDAGGSGYLLLGLSHVNLVRSTEVRWPNGVRTYLTEHGPAAIPHLGIGGDWQSPHGTRIGVELTSGGGEWMVVFAKIFVVWGPPLRSSVK